MFVEEIQPNREISGVFIVADKQLRTARNGSAFLTLKLVDKTGEIPARVWDRADETAAAIPPKGAVRIRGRSETFRDELQLNITELTVVPAGEIQPHDFLPACPQDVEKLFEELKGTASRIKRRSLQSFARHLLGDRELMDRFKAAPAAKGMHHAYLGGLLEHTASVAALTVKICEHYPDLDRDILIVGAILHDIGKIDEFVYDLCIDYSTRGRLVGHMVLGVEILEEKLRTLKNFPAEEAVLLKHLILSHHGEIALGAVRLPMTREAFVLHYADNLDAKMNGLAHILAEPRGGDDTWTAYQPPYERVFFRGFPRPCGEDSPTSTEDCEERGQQLTIWNTPVKRHGNA